MDFDRHSAALRETPSQGLIAQETDPRFKTLRNLCVGVWVYDIDASKIVFANSSAVALWNAESEEELCRRDLSKGMSSVVAERLRQYQKDFGDRSATFTENWTLYPKGKPVALNLLYSGFRLLDGRMAMMCEVLNSVREDPDNLRRADALLHADVMVSMFAENGPPIYFNPAARKATCSVTGHFRDMFVSAEDHDDLMFAVHDAREHRRVAKVHTADGDTWHDISVRHCTDPATGAPAILVTAFDVTDLKTARDTARYLAETDPLTNCHNRMYLNDTLESLMRAGKAQGAGLLYFDLDRFKQINDSFGHLVGDTVLQTTAARVKETLEPGETLARLGGDEFVLLSEGAGDLDALLARGEHIRKAIKNPILSGETRLRVSASVGAALVTKDVCDWSEAMRRADIALYHSKLVGRDRCSVYTEDMGRAASERASLENDLSEAIKKDQFVLYYQPRVNLRTGRVASAEALVRWRHPTRGLISPDVFIPLCEETGMIETLGAMIIVKACEQAVQWQRMGRDLSISINVSPRQFQSSQLIETVQSVSRLPGLQPGQIEFEITESVLVGDDAQLNARLDTIQSLGFHIAVDDFGTGYSNLANISRFPLHCIKIDKSFVDQLPSSEPIIQLIVTLAHQIGANIVAEGAEWHDQVRTLKTLGCDQVQGYFFSKPVPVDALLSVIETIESPTKAPD